MPDSRVLREILIAHLAVGEGGAAVETVTRALAAWWGDRDNESSTLLRGLEACGLPRSVCAELARAADSAITGAGGDVRKALQSRVSLRSLDLPSELNAALARAGVIRGPLREVARERYVDFSVAGEGGMGIVYMAMDTDMNRRVALKVVRPDAAAGLRPTPNSPVELQPPAGDTDAAALYDELSARFLQEAWLTGAMEHPGVVPVYEVGRTEGGVPYYTMRFLGQHETLETAIGRARREPFERRLGLLEPFLRLCDTVEYAHVRGIVHRDLKPENVALGEFGEVLVLDWGLAKIAGHDTAVDAVWRERMYALKDSLSFATRPAAMGTAGYMAPEAERGAVPEVDASSDVYSLGVMLFEILTGRMPFLCETYAEYHDRLQNEDAPAPAFVDGEVPEDLSRMCARTLSRDKADRPATAGALARAIRAWQARSVVERENEVLYREATAALAAADDVSGLSRLRQVDRAQGVIERMRARDPSAEGLAALDERAGRLREHGLAEREAAAKRRFFVRLAAVTLLVLTVAAFVVAGALEESRRRAEAARGRAKDLLLRSYQEHGRQELLLGRPDRSLAWLAAAYTGREEAERSHLLRFLTARATRAVERLRLVMRGHEGPVRYVVWSRDGSRVVSAGSDGTARVFDGRTGTEIRVVRHDERDESRSSREARAPQLTPDGRWLVTAGANGLAKVFDLRDGSTKLLHQSRKPSGEPAQLSSALLSPDGGLVCVCGARPAVHVYERATGRLLHRLEGHTSWVYSGRFDPAGGRIVTASDDATARIWDVATGRSLHVLSGHGLQVRAASFSADGQRVLTGSEDATGRVFDAASGKTIAVLEDEGMAPVWHAVFDATGERAATASEDGVVRVWDGRTGELLLKLEGHASWVGRVAFSRDGTRLASASSDGTARVWDVRTGALVSSLTGHELRVADIAFGPGDEEVATAGYDGTLRIWSAASPDVWRTLRGHTGAVIHGAFSHDGSVVVTVGEDGTVRRWDPRTGYELESRAFGPTTQAAIALGGAHVAMRGLDGEVRFVRGRKEAPLTMSTGRLQQFVVVTPDGRRGLFGAEDFARLIDLEEGEEIARIRAGAPFVYEAAVAPDGRRVAITATSRVLIVDAETGEVLSRLPTGARAAEEIRKPAWSEDGRYVAAGSKLGTVYLWPLSGGPATAIRAHSSNVSAIVFRPDSRQFATGSVDNTVRIWTLEGTLVAHLEGHDGAIRALSFNRDGRFLASVGRDATAHIWDAATGTALAHLRGHHGHLITCAFSPDGAMLLTAGAEGGAILWDLSPETRPATDLERLVRERAPSRVMDGRLVPWRRRATMRR